MNDLVKAIQEPAPATGEWAFGDDPEHRWVQVIEDLTSEDVTELWKNEFHREAVSRLRFALTETQALFEGRTRALETMVASGMARVNTVLLGPPGTAKSLMVRTFAEFLGVRATSEPISDESRLIDEALEAAANSQRQNSRRQGSTRRRFFEYLVTRYTTPEELFGGIDTNLLVKAGIHVRRTEGMLPQAEVAFLDEIFKANSAILNTLLSIINERLFYNMGRAFRVRLAFVVGASNETPDDEELGALFDRFPIRIPCERVDDQEVDSVIDKSRVFGASRLPRIACLNDLRLLEKIVKHGAYGGDLFPNNEFKKAYLKLLKELRDDYSISDRSAAQIVDVCRALALLERNGPAKKLLPEHLRAFGYLAPKMDRALDLQRRVNRRINDHQTAAPANLFDNL